MSRASGASGFRAARTARAGAQISQSIEVRCPAEAIPSSNPPIPAKSPATSIPKLSARVQTHFHVHILFTPKKVRNRAFPQEIPCRPRRGGSGVSEIGLPYYVWLLAGLALCAAETLVPGAFLIWIGAAGLILGAVEFFAPMTLTVQLLGFAALVVALVFVGRRVYGSIDAVGPSLPMGSRACAGGPGIFFWTKPSLAGSAASASTTASGGSPAGTCRREHGCASSRSKTVPAIRVEKASAANSRGQLRGV